MRRTLILFSASILALAGCSTSNPGTPSPANNTSSQTTSPSSSDEVPGPGVPKVEGPIDTTRFKQAPCDTLTATQVRALFGEDVTPKSDLAAPAGPACNWDSSAVYGAHIGVVFSTVTNLGLTGYYRAKGTNYPFFRELAAVGGYPAVAYDSVGDRSSKGACDIAVGTSDRETVAIAIQQSNDKIGEKDACESARDVAASVIGNLRGGK